MTGHTTEEKKPRPELLQAFRTIEEAEQSCAEYRRLIEANEVQGSWEVYIRYEPWIGYAVLLINNDQP